MDYSKLTNLIIERQNTLENEAQVKQYLVLPFLRELGFDPDNPAEVIPECIADLGSKKGEKVDYGIKINGRLQILVECKYFFKKDRQGRWKEQEQNTAQLSRYFHAANDAVFGILTDGIHYQFYADLNENKGMDLIPFLEINLENSPSEEEKKFLDKFHKRHFDAKSLQEYAVDLGCIRSVKEHLKSIFTGNIDEKFVRYLINTTNKNIQKINDNRISEYKDYLKKAIPAAINEHILELMNPQNHEEEISEENKIITTADELQAFYIIRAILSSEIDDIDKITYKDSRAYFSIMITDDKHCKTICRLYLGERKKSINFVDDGWDSKTKLEFSSLNDLYQYKDRFISILKSLL